MKGYELDEKEKEDLRYIRHYLEKAESLFSKLDRSLQNEILDMHNETASLNHCLRWGLQASQEVNKTFEEK